MRNLKNSTAARAVTAFAGPGAGADQADPVALVGQIHSAWEEFKAANDEAMKKQDVVLTEKVDRINNSISDLEKKVKEALDEQSKALARLTVGGQQTDDRDRDRFARAFVRDAMASRGAGMREIHASLRSGVDVVQYAAYVDAFNQLVAANLNVNMLSGDVRNALSVGSDPSGGYVVPPEVSTTFQTRIFETSPMRQIATIRTIASDAWEQPLDTGEGISGGWVAEKQARAKTGTPGVGMQRIEAHEQYAYPELTQKMLEDAVLIDPSSWLERKTADKMVRDENAAFVLGNGVGKPRGFLDYAAGASTEADKDRKWGKLQYVASGAAGAFPNVAGKGDVPDAIIDIIYALKPAFRAGAVWTMNRKSVATCRKLKDADGNYRWAPAMIAGHPSTMEGYAIEEMEDMPDIAANSFSIGFGDFREGYSIIDRLGMTVLVDPYTNKPYVGFYIRKRVGGDVTNFDAIKLMKFAA